mmetsp:Transcript_28279/g.95232  ORF Transcript_28279/g.95232 Transcript_28279/m.95232 type:complete len:202 (+) Transcript_28279:49-654(+)
MCMVYWRCFASKARRLASGNREALVHGRGRRVVLDVLLDEGQELAVEREDDALLAVLASRRANRHVKVNGRHDAVAKLLVDELLDGHAIVRERLVGAVDVGLLEDLLVPGAHGGDHHLLEAVRGQRGEHDGELALGRLLELRLAIQELARVGVGVAELGRDLVVRQTRRLLGGEALRGDEVGGGHDNGWWKRARLGEFKSD